MATNLTGIIGNEQELRAVYKQPTPIAVGKEIGHIDAHCRRFIELSPFICIGSMTPDGRGDVSPRGGAPGFVAVLDENRLAIPDRPGNNRLDTLLNILKQPAVGMLFFVPGFEDMLRVNGDAQITTDETLMRQFAVAEKLPLSVMVITVKQAQLHCPKAVKRAGLWDPECYVDRASFPTLGKILNDQLALKRDVGELDANLEVGNRKLY
jgi:uncharacterized protein